MSKNILWCLALFVASLFYATHCQTVGRKLEPFMEPEWSKRPDIIEFREMCEMNGGPDAFANVQRAVIDIEPCLMSLLDPGTLEAINKTQSKEVFDDFVKKNCAVLRAVEPPRFEGCFKDFTQTSKVCLKEAEHTHLKTLQDVYKQMVEFFCLNGEDVMTFFIGDMCSDDQMEAYDECTKQSFDPSNAIDSLNFIRTLDEKKCKDLEDQTCDFICGTPLVNLMESFRESLWKVIPCQNFANSSSVVQATAASITMFTFLTAATAVLLV